MTSKFKTLMLGTAFGTALLASVPALAQDGGEFSGNVAITTNYVFRGITQSDEGPAVSGGFDYANGAFYAGVWASSVDFSDGTGVEIDYYAGFAPQFGGVTWDTGVIYYSYPDSPDPAGLDQDFFEVYTGLSGTLSIIDLGIGVAYSPDFYLESGDAFYYNGSAAIPLGEMFTLDATVGYSEFDAGGDYTDWSLGLSTEFQGFGLDFRYADTDLTGADDYFYVTLSRSL